MANKVEVRGCLRQYSLPNSQGNFFVIPDVPGSVSLIGLRQSSSDHYPECIGCSCLLALSDNVYLVASVKIVVSVSDMTLYIMPFPLCNTPIPLSSRKGIVSNNASEGLEAQSSRPRALECCMHKAFCQHILPLPLNSTENKESLVLLFFTVQIYFKLLGEYGCVGLQMYESVSLRWTQSGSTWPTAEGAPLCHALWRQVQVGPNLVLALKSIS